MRILFVAPTSELKTADEILRSLQGQTVTICDGNVDRDKAERFLTEEYEYIHFAGHGDLSILEWSDGPVTVDELLGMLAHQTRLSAVVITACNSARTGAEIHNALHIPVVLCQAPLSDRAALRFSEAFYRALRTGARVHEAVTVGRAALAKLHPADADAITLINGDMSTRPELEDCMTFVRREIGAMSARLERMETGTRAQLDTIEAEMRDMKERQQPRMWFGILVLMALAAIGQWAQPWLAAAVAAGR